LPVAAALALVFALSAPFVLAQRQVARCRTGQASVTIDPGHGGRETGAVNDAFGLVEREQVTRIAWRAAEMLRAEGYSANLTRVSGETGMANSPRGRIANACGSRVYVSVHLNAVDDPDPNYALTLWANEEKDLAFAGTMQAALLAGRSGDPDLIDGGLRQLENGGMLAARMPAALLEPAFLTNPIEAGRLSEPGGARQERFARAVADGVEAWLWKTDGIPLPPERYGPAFALSEDDPIAAPPRGTSHRAMAAALAIPALRPAQVRAYVDELYRLGPEVGIDPAVAIAQSALETGYWQSARWAEQLNPAGIGITADDVEGPTWATGTDAARAQLVHLWLYANGEIPPDSPLAPYIPLDPRYDAALEAGRAGSATTVADLAGAWATDPDYAEKIARVGNVLFAAP